MAQYYVWKTILESFKHIILWGRGEKNIIIILVRPRATSTNPLMEEYERK